MPSAFSLQSSAFSLQLSDAVIIADNLDKSYKLFRTPGDWLKQRVGFGKRKYYQEIRAIRNVGFTVRRGESLGLIGSNGSGKSTLLQLISGILTPTHGTLTVQGKVAALLELGAGFNPEFTGRENIYINAAILGMNRDETDSRFDEMVRFADIGPFIDQPVKTYSSGMYVRLAFATAVHVSPDILIVDEALAVGDIRFQQKCMSRIKEFARTGTAVLVSHDLKAVSELCTRVLWIDAGTVRMDGPPKEVIEKYIQFLYSNGQGGQGEKRRAIPKTESRFTGNGFMKIAPDARQYGDLRAVIEVIRFGPPGQSGHDIRAEQACDICFVCRAVQDILNPIVGYSIRNGDGREIFDDRYPMNAMTAGNSYLIRFQIAAWPNIDAGDYFLSVGIADGTLENHVYCHTLFDALRFRSEPIMRPPAGVFSDVNTEFFLREHR